MAKKTTKKKPASKKTAKKTTKKTAKKATKKAAKKKAKRTTMYSSAGKKLYAVRKADGTFKDIQTYQRAHTMDMQRDAKAEQSQA